MNPAYEELKSMSNVYTRTFSRPMKSTHVFRNKAHDSEPEDSLKRAAKLEPIKKSGKEKRAIYSRLDEDDDDELLSFKKRESVLDYFDDGEEEQDER